MSEELTRKEKRQQRRAERRSKRKPFFETKVGGILKGVATFAAPQIVGALEGVGGITEAIEVISNSGVSEETKVRLKELILEEERIELEAFAAEVEDRASAREAEVSRLKAGGSNLLMNIIGFGTLIVFAFFVMVLSGLLKLNHEIDREFTMLAAGAVFGNMATLTAFYFGSSHKQK